MPHPYWYRGTLTRSEGKRSKLETETSTSTRSSSHDQHERPATRQFSGQNESTPAGYQMTESSPPIGSGRTSSGPPLPSKPTSPAPYPLSGLNSPRASGYYPPVAASPRSATLQKESSFDMSVSNLARDLRIQPDAGPPYNAAAYPHASSHSPVTTSPLHPLNSHYPAPVDLPSRRSFRDNSARLPPLTREDTTWSSESGQSGQNMPQGVYPSATLPLDPSKTSRVLPQPIPTFGLSTSPLDRPHPPPMSQIPPHDYRTQGPLAVLVRAGEIAARVADDDIMEDESSP